MNNTEKRILIILHRSCGYMGKIGEILTQRGYELDIRCVIEGDSLPKPQDYAAVVVFGGTMSVNDTDEIPAMQQEADWIPSVIKAGVPYLGICLGAQLLAKALGAKVSGNADESVEIGFHTVTPSRRGCDMFPEDGVRFYQWHLEGFELPQGCTLLAHSDVFPHQAFMLNEKTIGLQFHPEVTREMIDCWVQREPGNLSLSGAQSYKTQVELYREYQASVKVWLNNFLDSWLS